MTIAKRISAVIVSAALLGLGALVPATHARGMKLACLLEGTAKTDPPMSVTENKGGYTFDDLNLVCVGVEKRTNPVVLRFSVTASGVYKNLVCGTGKVTSTRTVLNSISVIVGTPTKDYLALFPLLKYQVEFVAWHGVWYWHNDEITKTPVPAPKVLPDPKPPSKPQGSPGGVVSLSPDPAKAFAPCTKALRLEASVLIDTEATPI